MFGIVNRSWNCNYKKIRFPNTCGLGIKPISKEGTSRLVQDAIQYAIDNNRSSVTLVHINKAVRSSYRQGKYVLKWSVALCLR